ncbi:hypothetical protein M405DRAFT_842096 [Rhizopogon salebrosus TDB-379]|nr:hypothetical protein M405DRAFT_842096 [Rhizopogon salebrosus TDB-379]
MQEDQQMKKRRWRPWKRGNPDQLDRGGEMVNESELLESFLQGGSRRGLGQLVHGTLGKFTKSSSTLSAGRPQSFAPTSSSISVQDTTNNHPSEGALPHTDLVSEPNLGQPTNSGDAKAKPPDQQLVKERIDEAARGVTGSSQVPGIAQKIASASNDLQSPTASDAIDTFSQVLAPLKAFHAIANGIADIHPYAKAVLSIFTYASKIIIDQADRDDAVRALLEKLSEFYEFMNVGGRLAEIESMQVLFGNMARQAFKCADFIVHYSETKSAWKRLARDITTETGVMIQSYSQVLDALMQQFRDSALRDTAENVRLASASFRTFANRGLAGDLNFKDMVYVDGAGRDTSKRCLPGTRKDILSEIQDWVDNTGGDMQRVFWLSGTAGKGKSAIAHTITNWFHEHGGPVACFCFDRTQEAERRHDKIFTTIARDLADRDPIIRRTLASVVLASVAHERHQKAMGAVHIRAGGCSFESR